MELNFHFYESPFLALLHFLVKLQHAHRLKFKLTQ